jgi:hypothetical protein
MPNRERVERFMKETTKKPTPATKKEPGREAGSKNKITLNPIFFISGFIDISW